jgi:Skp family chaperone for outer membrane proteins
MSTENNSNQPNTQIFRSKISNGTIINVVLFIGLIVLYTLNFLPVSSHETTTERSEGSVQFAERSDGSLHIGFVKSDSIMANYKLAVQMRSEFEVEQRRLDNDLQRRQRSFQTEVEKFQNQIQTGAISMENAQKKEQELMQQRDELMQLNDNYTNRLMVKEVEINNELYGKITSLLEVYSKEMGYDYILGFAPGGGILYAGAQHDITQQVLEKLNREHDSKK